MKRLTGVVVALATLAASGCISPELQEAVEQKVMQQDTRIQEKYDRIKEKRDEIEELRQGLGPDWAHAWYNSDDIERLEHQIEEIAQEILDETPELQRCVRELLERHRELRDLLGDRALRQTIRSTEIRPTDSQEMRVGFAGPLRDRDAVIARADQALSVVDARLEAAGRYDAHLRNAMVPAFQQLLAASRGLSRSAPDRMQQAPATDTTGIVERLAAFDTALAMVEEALTRSFQIDLFNGHSELGRLLRELGTAMRADVVLPRSGGRRPSVHLTTRLGLSPAVVGRIDVGDILVFRLPEGVRLTDPVEVSADGAALTVSGNQSGSSEVSVLVTAVDTGTSPTVWLVVDQPLVVDRNAPTVGLATFEMSGSPAEGSVRVFIPRERPK